MPAAGASLGNQGGSTRAQYPVTATGLEGAADGRWASAEVLPSPSPARSRRAGCLNWASPDLREAQRVTAGPTRLAPGKLEKGGRDVGDNSETLRWNPAGNQSRPAEWPTAGSESCVRGSNVSGEA
jgi:hypothetical protein